jgi:adenosine deaminase
MRHVRGRERHLRRRRAVEAWRDDIVRLARNSFAASFLGPAEKRAWLGRIDAYSRP